MHVRPKSDRVYIRWEYHIMLHINSFAYSDMLIYNYRY